MPNLAEPVVDFNVRQKVQLNSAALSKAGRARPVNQDSVFHWTGISELGQSLGLAMVCDGLGGHAAGDMASRLAVETISGELVSILQSAGSRTVNDPHGPSVEEMAEWVFAAVRKANSQIFNYANSHRDALNMGTTVTLAALFENLVQVANVGDSRTYLLRKGELAKITHDHSFVAEMVEHGLLREEEAANHPKDNVILRAVGTEAEVDIDVFTVEVQPGDKLLLCSDGFWKPFSGKEELAQLLQMPGSATDLCKQLAIESYSRSGSDDTSLALIIVE